MVWHAQTEWLSEDTLRCRIFREEDPLSFAEVIDAWRENEAFAVCFSGMLAQAPFAACYWELPPLLVSSLDQVFECVLVDSPELARVATESRAFAEHFSTGCDVVTFENLGGDAELVAPCPRGPVSAYAHLSVFARQAPAQQQRVLWQSVATAVQRRLSNRPLWLSTSGLGVYWLHIRLDARPKYYQHAPYRKFPRLDS